MSQTYCQNCEKITRFKLGWGNFAEHCTECGWDCFSGFDEEGLEEGGVFYGEETNDRQRFNRTQGD